MATGPSDTSTSDTGRDGWQRRFDQATQAALSYPVQTKDPSLGMAHIFSQIKNKAENGHIISPSPYDIAKFEKPAWMT